MHEILYETAITLRAHEADFCGFWRPSAIHLAMQEAAEAHACRLGAGWEALRAKKLAWVLAKSCVEMDSYPRFGQTVRLRTWPGKTRHQIFPRYFEFETDSGEPLGRAATAWALLDTETRRMAAGAGLEIETNDTRPAPLGMPRAPRALDAPAQQSVRRVAYEDLDINGHMNNTRYVDWLCDALPCGLFARAALRTLTVAYESETLAGEAVTLSLSQKEDAFFLVGEADGRTCFSAGGRFAPRQP